MMEETVRTWEGVQQMHHCRRLLTNCLHVKSLLYVCYGDVGLFVFLPCHDIPLGPLHTGSLSRISVTKCQDIIQLMLSSATLK